MACFMGCFGLSSTKKRRNSIRKILPRDQRICSYEPLLHSSDPTHFSTVLYNPEEKISNSILSFEEEEEKKKETKKTRKGVRFNLNVQIYEPLLQTTFEIDDCNVDEEDSSSKSVYPSNYRYQNCVDSFEDEDEISYGESDLEEDEEDYYEDDADDEDEEDDQLETPLLNHPIENLAQWKAVKAKPLRVKQIMKENANTDDDDQEKPLLKEIIVNTSLSNWITSSKRSPISDITNMEKEK